MQEQVGYGGDFVYDKAIGHEIKWKEDKDLTKKVEIKKQRNKSAFRCPTSHHFVLIGPIPATGRTRVVRKVVSTDSFFNFFKPPQPPNPETLETSDVDEDELEELDARLETDYQIGEDFKEKIIPRAVDYFTGKALKYEEDFEDEADEVDEEDDFDDDEDEASWVIQGKRDLADGLMSVIRERRRWRAMRSRVLRRERTSKSASSSSFLELSASAFSRVVWRHVDPMFHHRQIS
jgi:hypothetical protein